MGWARFVLVPSINPSPRCPRKIDRIAARPHAPPHVRTRYKRRVRPSCRFVCVTIEGTIRPRAASAARTSMFSPLPLSLGRVTPQRSIPLLLRKQTKRRFYVQQLVSGPDLHRSDFLDNRGTKCIVRGRLYIPYIYIGCSAPKHPRRELICRWYVHIPGCAHTGTKTPTAKGAVIAAITAPTPFQRETLDHSVPQEKTSAYPSLLLFRRPYYCCGNACPAKGQAGGHAEVVMAAASTFASTPLSWQSRSSPPPAIDPFPANGARLVFTRRKPWVESGATHQRGTDKQRPGSRQQ